ncbi:hypothetical protein ACIQ7D_17985 [Streptomyces sp. NPDC096310]|uniref:hypothetical protein n=1 Tax=Streptomyces sp. NPDC096310 TaxID=3366082 RepID=UPI0038112F53
MTDQLPHDPYITAVGDALAAVGMDAAHHWTSDADTRGLHHYLNATLTLTSEDSGIDPALWPNGLLLIWEWHPGREDGEADRGPVWLWAKQLRDGGNSTPEVLPVDGYANPLQVAAAGHELAITGRAVKRRPGQWTSARGLTAAITVWEEA